MATGVKSWSTTAATNASADSNINWAEGQAPSSVNDSARYMMKAIADLFAQLAGGVISTGTVGGSANAITLTCSPTVDALVTGQMYAFALTANTTSTVTLTVDSLTAKAVKYKSTALISGDGATGDIWYVIYNGTDYELITPPRLSAFATDWPTDTTGGDVADLLVLADASQSNAINKTTVQKVLDNALTSLTADTTPDVADSLLTYDASATAAKSTTVTNFYKTINTLTADATGATGDKIPTYDISASGAKYILISTLQTLLKAAQSDQETASSTALFVTPGVQQSHPSACKAWVVFAPGASPTAAAGYNIASIAKNGTGDYTITFTTAFSSASYGAVVTMQASTTGTQACKAGTLTASTAQVLCYNTNSTGGTETGLTAIHAAFYGDQ